ncbi:BnaCnng13330D [Brassica napus]|uniref:BnaCnng13330D protein n=1 Tax=Brassica napus TaxID=3708 RepID=A0A078I488_BRANA|nr:BnaCnng13330D [Brassica napus]
MVWFRAADVSTLHHSNQTPSPSHAPSLSPSSPTAS